MLLEFLKFNLQFDDETKFCCDYRTKIRLRVNALYFKSLIRFRKPLKPPLALPTVAAVFKT